MKSKASECLELGMWVKSEKRKVKSEASEYLELGMWVKSEE